MVNDKLKSIYSKAWILVVIPAIPLLFIIGVFAWKDRSPEIFVQNLAIMIFVLGIGLIATRLSSYVLINRSLQEIDRLDKAKTDFIAIASHQLKSPIAAVRWKLQDIETCVEDKDWIAVSTKIKDLDASIERLSKLTADLLDVTTIDTGKIIYEPAEINIDEIINQVVSDMAPLAKQSHLTITYQESGKSDGTVYCDANLFTNVLQNLLSNALKYSKPHTDILVNRQVNGGVMDISVTNQASQPVSAEMLKNLFQKFYRTDAVREKQIEGSGLGLFIVKSYVEKWGGIITASRKSNDSISFQFSVPLHKAA